MLAGACSQSEAPNPSASPDALGTPEPPTATPALFRRADLTSAYVARVIDGDTIEVVLEGRSYTVRYIGVNTPETVAPGRPVECYGKEASDFNKTLVEGTYVGLENDVSETDEFGRLLRYVWLTDNEMLNAILVREGYASASTYPPDIKYQELFVQLEAVAREEGKGLWSPDACKAMPTVSPEPVAAVGGAGDDEACEYSGTAERVIKGNISVDEGEKIYHVPGGGFYDATVIDETRGERWFCTEGEAVAAGWRRSKR